MFLGCNVGVCLGRHGKDVVHDTKSIHLIRFPIFHWEFKFPMCIPTCKTPRRLFYNILGGIVLGTLCSLQGFHPCPRIWVCPLKGGLGDFYCTISKLMILFIIKVWFLARSFMVSSIHANAPRISWVGSTLFTTLGLVSVLSLGE
jgi:hypothetical protein